MNNVKILNLITKNSQGAPGFEPGTSRSAVECSTTELYPHVLKDARNNTIIVKYIAFC